MYRGSSDHRRETAAATGRNGRRHDSSCHFDIERRFTPCARHDTGGKRQRLIHNENCCRHERQVDNTVGTLCDASRMPTARSLLLSFTSVTNGVPTTMRGREAGSNNGIA